MTVRVTHIVPEVKVTHTAFTTLVRVNSAASLPSDGGGSSPATSVTFAAVRDALSLADSPLDLNGQRMSGGDPINPSDFVTLDYFENNQTGGGGGGTSSVVDRDSNGLAPEMGEYDDAPTVLVDDGNTHPTWRRLSIDDLAPAFNASLSGGQSLEVGQSVVNPSFTASYTGGPATSATITDNDGNAALTLSSPYTAGTMPHTYAKTANNASTVFTLSANKGGVNDTAQVSFSWQPRGFWGATATVVDTEAEVEALASSGLQSSRARAFTVNAGAGEYIWYAYPASYGAATFTVGGFEGGFDLISSTLSITNAYGVTQNYRLYRSTNPSLGSTTVVVS